MKRIKFKVTVLSEMPIRLNRVGIENWDSSIFELTEDIQSQRLPSNADIDGIGYSDNNLARHVHPSDEADAILAIVTVPLQDNYYARRLGNNRAVISFFQMKEILQSENIPLENLVLRVLYAYTILMLRNKGHLPDAGQLGRFTHDDTRGCLFDMNMSKYEVVHSCDGPKLCSECEQKCLADGISIETLAQIKSELKRIKKDTYYHIADWIRRHPVRAILISSLWAFIIGTLGSMAASYLWALLKLTH